MAKKRSKKSISLTLRNYFITGVVVLIPIGFTIYLTKILIGISSNIIPKNINPNSYLPFNVPGVEIIITVIFITHVLKEAILLGDRILFFSKKPGTVVFDYKVQSKKQPLTLDNKSVDNEYKKLKKKFPQLLEGLI